MTAALRRTGMVAPLVLDGAMDGACFLAYVEQMLVPVLNRRKLIKRSMYGRAKFD